MKILFPTDGSTATEEAFDRLLALLDGMHKAVEITILNVLQEGFEGADPEYVEETYERDERDEVFPSQAAGNRAIGRCLTIAENHGVAAEVEMGEGNYRELILEKAKGYDLLAMHELRKSNFKDLLKGSGTEKLARKAPCHVLLVQTQEID